MSVSVAVEDGYGYRLITLGEEGNRGDYGVESGEGADARETGEGNGDEKPSGR